MLQLTSVIIVSQFNPIHFEIIKITENVTQPPTLLNIPSTHAECTEE